MKSRLITFVLLSTLFSCSSDDVIVVEQSVPSTPPSPAPTPVTSEPVNRVGEFVLATSTETDFMVLSSEERFAEVFYANAIDVFFDAEGQLVTKEGYLPAVVPINPDGSAASLSLATSEFITVDADGNPIATSEVTLGVQLPRSDFVIDPLPSQSDLDGNCELAGELTAGISSSVYDSLGERHTLTTSFALANTETNSWYVYAQLDCRSLLAGTPVILDFDESGSLDLDDVDGDGVRTSGNGAITFDPLPLDNGAQDIELTMRFPEDTSLNNSTAETPFEIRLLENNGRANDAIDRFELDNRGVVSVRYVSGETVLVGRLLLAKFPSPANLTSVSEGIWQQSDASGEPAYGVALTVNFDAMLPTSFNY